MKGLLILILLHGFFAVGCGKATNRRIPPSQTLSPEGANDPEASTEPEEEEGEGGEDESFHNGTVADSHLNGTADRQYHFPNYPQNHFPHGPSFHMPQYPGGPHVFPYPGPHSGPSVPFPPNSVPWPHGCKYWCGRNPPVCCDGIGRGVPKCPGVRATCGNPYRSYQQPRFCLDHSFCLPSELCCIDACLERPVCKPSE